MAVLSASVVFIHIVVDMMRLFPFDVINMTSIFDIQCAVRSNEVYSRLSAKGMDLVGNIGVQVIIEAIGYHSFQSFHPEIFSAF